MVNHGNDNTSLLGKHLLMFVTYGEGVLFIFCSNCKASSCYSRGRIEGSQRTIQI